ncbi:MAG: ChaN family lipoprotein [Desulfonatronovibrio sp.]
MIKRLLLLSVILLAGCASKYPATGPLKDPLPGTFFSASDEPLFINELVSALKENDFILIGESHNNQCDHKVQARIIEEMAWTGKSFALGLEMVSVERQDTLDRFNNGLIDVDNLHEMLHWDENWGFDYELYRMIFEASSKYSVPVFALNVPGEITRNISRYGMESLSFDEKIFLPEKIIYPPQEQVEILERQFEFHQDMIQADEPYFQRFIDAQSVWDTKMASEAIRIHKESQEPVVILSGSMHVNYGHGIEHRLQSLMPQARVTSIVPARSLEMITPDNPYYFFCPPVRSGMRLGIVASEEDGKVMLTGVVKGSLAESAGLEKHDEIVNVDGKFISSMADLHQAAVDAVQGDGEMVVEVLRNGRKEFINIEFMPDSDVE